MHDKEGGQINGPNIIYLFVIGGLRCVHMGDVGTPVLTDFDKKMIGKVDRAVHSGRRRHHHQCHIGSGKEMVDQNSVILPLFS